MSNPRSNVFKKALRIQFQRVMHRFPKYCATHHERDTWGSSSCLRTRVHWEQDIQENCDRFLLCGIAWNSDHGVNWCWACLLRCWRKDISPIHWSHSPRRRWQPLKFQEAPLLGGAEYWPPPAIPCWVGCYQIIYSGGVTLQGIPREDLRTGI